MRAADDRDAEILRLQLRVRGLENEVERWRRRAFYAEAEAKEAQATICPMAIGDPHRACGMAEALSDTLARACARDPTLSGWLDETAQATYFPEP